MFRALPSLRPSLALYAFRTFATTVPANLVKQLRDSTGAPMMECKNALLASDNDVTKAVDWLRKKGKAAAMKSAGRTASQGLVAFAVNAGGNAGALIEVREHHLFFFLAREEWARIRLLCGTPPLPLISRRRCPFRI